VLEKDAWSALRSHLARWDVRALRVENRIGVGTGRRAGGARGRPRSSVWIEMKSIDRVVVELVDRGQDRRFNPLKIPSFTRPQQMFLVDWRGMLVVRTNKQGWLLWTAGRSIMILGHARRRRAVARRSRPTSPRCCEATGDQDHPDRRGGGHDPPPPRQAPRARPRAITPESRSSCGTSPGFMRRRAGMTVGRYAKVMRTSKVTIHAWERGAGMWQTGVAHWRARAREKGFTF